MPINIHTHKHVYKYMRVCLSGWLGGLYVSLRTEMSLIRDCRQGTFMELCVRLSDHVFTYRNTFANVSNKDKIA